MKRSTYNIISFFLLVLLSIPSFSQNETLYTNTFSTTNFHKLTLDIENIPLEIQSSLDDNIHVFLKVEFKNYSKDEIKKEIEKLKVKTLKQSKTIELSIKSTILFSKIEYSYESDSGIIISGNYSKKKIQKEYKTTEEVINSISKDDSIVKGSMVSEILKQVKNIKNSKSKKTSFIIKVPEKLKVTLKSINSNVTFKYNLVAPFSLNSFKGNYKFKKILSENNRIIASNGIFQAEEVTNASIEFLDMSKVVIGEISNTELATETSKIEFGEVGKNVDTKDFNSKIYSYNFSDNFGKFSFKGEYSKLFFYDIKKSNFSMDVFGQNTALNFKDIKTTFGISKDKKLDKILEKKVESGKVSKGNITIELINGILNIK